MVLMLVVGCVPMPWRLAQYLFQCLLLQLVRLLLGLARQCWQHVDHLPTNFGALHLSLENGGSQHIFEVCTLEKKKFLIHLFDSQFTVSRIQNGGGLAREFECKFTLAFEHSLHLGPFCMAYGNISFPYGSSAANHMGGKRCNE